MSFIATLLARCRHFLRGIFRRDEVERELREELDGYVAMLVAQKLAEGMSPREALRAARLEFGGLEQVSEQVRDVRLSAWVDQTRADLRYAGRTLGRSPGFAALAIVIMALGIGANTAVFSVVKGVLLEPLPYPGADRIVTLATRTLATGENNPLVNIANFLDWREQSTAFEAMAVYSGGEFPVTAGTAAEYARIARVEAPFFHVFGVDPIIGRTFTAEEAVREVRALLVSHAYWQGQLGGDTEVLERTVRVGDDRWRIMGVLPPGFRFPNRTDIWIPRATSSTSRTRHNVFAVGRLEPQVSLERARSELNTIATRLEQQYPDSNAGRGVAATRLQDGLVSNVRQTLYLLWGVVGIVLLIACANTATLLLGRAAGRTREIAVRAALGAGRGRIVRQLLAESLLLALVAGAAGVLLARWMQPVLVALTPADVVRLADTGIDGGALVFTLTVSIATSGFFGLVPALHASRVDLIDAARQGGLTAGGTVRVRGVLVVAQVAMAVVLLTAAGLLVKSLVALQNVELGFRPENVLVMKATGAGTTQENNAFFGNVMSRVAALPGVVAAGATSTPPGDLSNSGSGSYFIDRMPEQRDRTVEPQALLTIVAPQTFAALGISLKSGRDFNAGDIDGRPLVAVVNEALVQEGLAGENPIGRTIFCPFDRREGMTIVGVVGDVRQRNPALAPQPECYMPYTQHAYNNDTLHVVARTLGDPTALAETVRRLAADISPGAAASVSTMEAAVARRVEPPRFRALLFGVLAGFAAFLAAAGVYGVMAYAVEQRKKELGLRMALGAGNASLMWLILGQGLVLAAAGLATGLAAAAGVSGLLATVLFDTRPLDAQVYLGVVVFLTGVTLLAGYVPARRATDMDPVQVLKAD